MKRGSSSGGPDTVTLVARTRHRFTFCGEADHCGPVDLAVTAVRMAGGRQRVSSKVGWWKARVVADAISELDREVSVDSSTVRAG